MKKYDFNKKYLEIAFICLMVIIISIIFSKSIDHIENLFASIGSFFKTVLALFAPFIMGICLAYFICFPMMYIEKNIFGKIAFFSGKSRAIRNLSVLVTYLILISTIVLLISFIVPEVTLSFQTMLNSIYYRPQNNTSGAYQVLKNSPVVSDTIYAINSLLNKSYTFDGLVSIGTAYIIDLIYTLPTMASTILTGTINAASNAVNFILSIIISIYFLSEKEYFQGLLKKIILVVFSKRMANKIIEISKIGHTTFRNFFIGKIIDSAIVGILFFVTCKIIGLPFALLISIIIAVTNMIPYFGPFIGAVPAVIIVALSDPIKGLWTLIAIIVLQQIDGNIIGPKILGDSIGVKPISVMLSIIIGGALFGIPGMFFGVPVYAVFSKILVESINKKYDKKYLM